MKHFPKITIPLFAAAFALLIFSTIGGARASLAYRTTGENAQVVMEMSAIGITLNENGQPVANRDYIDKGRWDTSLTRANLLQNMTAEGEEFNIGTVYPEALTLTNTGRINTYDRVIIYKYWTDASGKKDQSLDPSLIELEVLSDGWVADTVNSTPERTVYYYTKVLKPDETTTPLTSTVRVNPTLTTKVKKEVVSHNADGSNTIKTSYAYDGYNFNVEVEANAVQTHNAEDAIMSAWGREVSIAGDEGPLSLK